MPRKPTYEELQDRLIEMEAEIDRLRRERDECKAVPDRMPLGIHIYTLDSDDKIRFTGANPAADIILHIDNSKLIGKTIFEAFPEIDKTDIPEKFRKLAKEGGYWEKDAFFYKDDQISGYYRNFNFQISPNKMATVFVDISDIVILKDSLAESLDKQKAAVKAANVGLWEWDLRKNKVHYSSEWKNQIGYDDHEISNDFDEWESRVHPEDLQQVLTKVKQSIDAVNQDHEVEFRFRHKDGSYLWILAQASVIPDESGQPVKMIGSHINITENRQVESKLFHSKEQFRKLYENSPFGIIVNQLITDAQGKPVDFIHLQANPSTPAQLGMSISDLVGTKATEIADKETAAKFIHKYGEVVRTGMPCEFEYYFSHHDRTLWVTAFHLVDDLFITTFTNITERKRAEDDLRESEKLLLEAHRNAHIAHWSFDTVTGINWWSDELFRIYGLDPDDGPLTYAEHPKLIHPDDWQRVDATFRDSVESGMPYDIIFRILRPDGDERILSAICQPVTDDTGAVVQMRGTIQDITTLKQVESRLSKSEDWLLRAQKAGHIGIWSINLIDDTVQLSEEAAHFHGLSPGCYTGDELHGTIPPEDLPRLNEAFERAVKTGSEFNIEHRIISLKTGKVTWVDARGESVCDGEGTPIQLIGTAMDITDRKRVQIEREEIQRKSIQTQKMEAIGNLAGGIAHDFNNILSAIIGFTEIALEDIPKGTEVEDSLQEVFTAGKRAKDLVQQILTFARQSDEERTYIQPKKIVKEVLKFIRSTIPSSIEIQQNLNSESWISGNEIQIHQVLMNLCTNAAHAMEDSGGVLAVSMKDMSFAKQDLPNGLKAVDYVEIKVMDTGSGIAPEVLDSIFEPYFTTKEPGEGTGMGLAVVQGVIESYEGKISVSSEMGKGTEFTCYLPIIRIRSGLKGYEPEQLPTGTERVLVVDDEYPIAKICSQILSRLGYHVTTRTSSIEALELFKSKPADFDLIITDMTMPNMTGEKLASEMMKYRSDIPVILCTGYSKKMSDITASETGIKAFAYKPIVKADLAKTVRKVLDEVVSQIQD